MSTGNNPQMYNTNFVAAAAAAASAAPTAGGYHQTDFAPPSTGPGVSTTSTSTSTSARNKNMPGSPSASHPKDGRSHSTSKTGGQKLSKSKPGSVSSTSRNNSITNSGSTIKGSGGGGSNSNANKSSSKSGSGNNKSSSGSSSANNSRQVQSNTTTLDFNTPKQVQLLSQCDYADRTIWATRVLWGGNSVNGFLRATATAQRIKKQRARQNNSTKMSRAAKAAGTTGVGGPGAGGPGVARAVSTGEDDKKGASSATTFTTGPGPGPRPAGSSILNNAKSNSSALSGTKAKEIFNQHEEELLKKEIMNPRTAKKLKSELESGLTFCATVCNVLRGVLFDMDPSLSPSLPPHLIIEQEKPPPAHTFLIPSNPPPGSTQHQRLSTGSGVNNSTGTSKLVRGTSKSKVSTNPGSMKGASVNKNAGVTKQQQQPSQQQPSIVAQNTTSSPGDPGNSTLRRLRKTNKKNKGQSIFVEPAFANLPPEFDPVGSNKRTCTKKEFQHRVFQLLRYRDLKEGDFCAARLSSRDLWILAKVLKEYKTNSVTSLYTLSPLEFLSLTDNRRDALFQKERVLLEDVEDQQEKAGTQVIRSLVIPLPRSSAEANEWSSRLIKKGSRVYAMYPQTTSLYAATVTDSTTYCRGDDDIIVVQFDGEDADLMTGQFPSYHIPARFVILIPREFSASQSGRNGGGGGGAKSSSASMGTSSSNKRRSTSVSSGNSNKRRSSSAADSGGFLDSLSMDLGDNGLGGFDDLDLDFDKPLDEHEQQAAQEGSFSPF